MHSWGNITSKSDAIIMNIYQGCGLSLVIIISEIKGRWGEGGERESREVREIQRSNS